MLRWTKPALFTPEGKHTTKFVLASASPRRRELLGMLLGDEGFTVMPSTFDEKLDKSKYSPGAYAQATAAEKAAEVAASPAVLNLAKNTHVVVIGCDTVVEVDGKILEKPKDEEDASAMLQTMSKRTHNVHTGVSLIAKGEKREFYETTEVEFGAIPPGAIPKYVASGEPMDKAGGYGIQGIAGCFVSRINGCYFNVVGLPLHRIGREISDMDLYQ